MVLHPCSGITGKPIPPRQTYQMYSLAHVNHTVWLRFTYVRPYPGIVWLRLMYAKTNTGYSLAMIYICQTIPG